MTKPDWPSIKRDYVETTWTLAEVESKWGVRRGTLSSRAARENWNDEKQQFAAKLEQTRREKVIAKRAADQAQFDSAVITVASGQLRMIARQMQDELLDPAKLLKLANALEKVQRIGSTAFACMEPERSGAVPERAQDPSRSVGPSE